jgi:hypothetical protein
MGREMAIPLEKISTRRRGWRKWLAAGAVFIAAGWIGTTDNTITRFIAEANTEDSATIGTVTIKENDGPLSFLGIHDGTSYLRFRGGKPQDIAAAVKLVADNCDVQSFGQDASMHTIKPHCINIVRRAQGTAQPNRR